MHRLARPVNCAPADLVEDQFRTICQLTAAGQLSTHGPERAADHLSALTFGQIITGGVRVFLCAYGPRSR
jgi:hypothetical protein